MAEQRKKRVLIEFTSNTDEGRETGQRLLVDPMSADSFVNKRKVAKLVGDAEEKAEAREVVKAVKAAEPASGDTK